MEEGAVCVRIPSVVAAGHSPVAVASPVEWAMGGSHSVEGRTLPRQSSTTGHQWEETQECEGESSGLQNTANAGGPSRLPVIPALRR